MEKRGQAWSMDIIIAFIIFLTAIIIFFIYSVNYSGEVEDILRKLTYDGEIIFESILSKGYPSDWITGNVVNLGIISEGRINETKLERFYTYVQNNYSESKGMFNTEYDYYFFLGENVTINSQEVEGFGKPGVNKNNIDSANLIKITRFTIYRDKPTAAYLYIWQSSNVSLNESDSDGDGVLDKDDYCLTIPGNTEFQGCSQWLFLNNGNLNLKISGSGNNFNGGHLHSNGPIDISGSDNFFTDSVSSNLTITISGSNNNADSFDENQPEENFNFINCYDLTAANWTLHTGNLIISDSDQIINGDIVVDGFITISGENVIVNGGLAATGEIIIDGSNNRVNNAGLALCANDFITISGSNNNLNGISHVVGYMEIVGSQNNLNSIITGDMIDISGSENTFIYNRTNWEEFDSLLQEIN